MAVGYVLTVRNAKMAAVNAAVGSNGKLRIYSGTRPATGGTATTQLAELPLSTTFGVVSNGALTANAITTDATADANGTATWARLLTSANAAVADLTVSVTGGGGELQISTVEIVAGVAISVTSLTLTEGNP